MAVNWFDQSPKLEGDIYTPPKRGALSAIGTALSGISAPYLGNYDFGMEQMKLQIAQQQADQEFQKYLLQSRMKQGGKPLITIDPVTGEPKVVGIAPQGSQVIPFPVSPEQKAQQDARTASLKDQTTRANKLTELNKVIDFFETKIGELPVGSGVGGRLEGMGQVIAGKIGKNEKAAAYQADVEGLRSQIARGLGEVGNLSEQEQKAASKLLPNLSDNAETRAQKIKNFREYIQVKLGGEASASSVQTFNVGGKTYNIPAEKVEAFKKAKGIK